MSHAVSDLQPPVPCLAGLYLALGDGDRPDVRSASPVRRAVAAAAAGLLAAGMVAWPVLPVALAGHDRPAATLPEWPDLAAADARDREE